MTRDLPPRTPSTGTFVRPFVITGGRTRATDASLRLETMVQAVRAPARRVSVEHARIVETCWDPNSIAEVAAKCAMPLGVAMVLVGDLVDAGCLEVHNPVEIELSTLTRMIDRVRAL